MEKAVAVDDQQQQEITYSFPLNHSGAANDDPPKVLQAIKQHDVISCKVYRRRWLMLAIFVLVSMSNAFLWLQYSIITDIIMKYVKQ